MSRPPPYNPASHASTSYALTSRRGYDRKSSNMPYSSGTNGGGGVRQYTSASHPPPYRSPEAPPPSYTSTMTRLRPSTPSSFSSSSSSSPHRVVVTNVARRDRVVERTTRSFLPRVGDSFGIALLGGTIVVASAALLWWNESRAVEEEACIGETKNQVRSVSGLSKQNDGALIHFTGSIDTPAGEGAQDDDMTVNDEKLLLLNREVEMYQWTEDVKTTTEKHTGGSETTTREYTYKKSWKRGSPARHQDFKEPNGHENPEPLMSSESIVASSATIGPFNIDPREVKSLSREARSILLQNNPYCVLTRRDCERRNGWYYLSGPDAHEIGRAPLPEVGDTRVRFTGLRAPLQASVIGIQEGDSIVPSHTLGGHAGRLILQNGVRSAREMLDSMSSGNQALLYTLRAIGLVINALGFRWLLQPLVTGASVLPFLGKLAGVGATAVGVPSGLSTALISMLGGWLDARVNIPALKYLIRASSGFLILITLRYIFRFSARQTKRGAKATFEATKSAVQAIKRTL